MVLRITFSEMARARRAARGVTNGEAILDFVVSKKASLVKAADKGLAPVSVVSDGLKARFPREMDAAPVRQFIGSAVKAVLVGEGFEVHQSGVRLPKDPVFSTGSVYRRSASDADPAKAATHDAFARLVSGLNLSDKRLLLDVLRTSLGDA